MPMVLMIIMIIPIIIIMMIMSIIKIIIIIIIIIIITIMSTMIAIMIIFCDNKIHAMYINSRLPCHLCRQPSLPLTEEGFHSKNLEFPWMDLFSDVHIVDGSNSAPVNRLFIPLFTRFCTAEKMTFQNCF